MKKIKILIALAFAVSSIFGQKSPILKEYEKDKTKSNLEAFSEKSGSLLQKDFIEIGKIGRIGRSQVEVGILKISDLINESSYEGLRLTYDSYSTTLGSDSKIAFIDKDEVDGLLKSLYLIRDKILQTNPENYQEVYFTSRSGFQAGCFVDKKDKWKLYMKLEKYDSRSNVFFDEKDIAQIISTIEQGKEKL